MKTGWSFICKQNIRICHDPVSFIKISIRYSELLNLTNFMDHEGIASLKIHVQWRFRDISLLWVIYHLWVLKDAPPSKISSQNIMGREPSALPFSQDINIVLVYTVLRTTSYWRHRDWICCKEGLFQLVKELHPRRKQSQRQNLL